MTTTPGKLRDVSHKLVERIFHSGFEHFPFVLYFGDWQIDTSITAGARSNTHFNAFEFSFRGPEVRWIGSSGPDQGFADVFMDGKLCETVDSYSADVKNDVVKFKKNDLTGDRIHTLRVVVKKERNPKASDCYQQISYLQAEEPVNYPREISNAMAAEYATIEAGKKKYLEPGTWKPVSNLANVPPIGVKLHPGPIHDAFFRNIDYLNHSFASPTFCDGTHPRGNVWSEWLPASNEGRLLQGAGNTLRWEEREDMRAIVDTLVDRIEARMRDDGYFNYYDESDSYALEFGANSERKNYDRVFWTRGLLAAGMAGSQKAHGLLRKMYDWFNSSPYLPRMLHGGNATNGMPGGPLIYLSPAGTEQDLITNMLYYDQDYWINELSNREPLCLSHYPGERPHCYDLLGIEAFADEYRATGAEKYLDATKGAWDIYRNNYKHIGGATSIMESVDVYPPKSYHFEKRRIGETCGSVFWIYVNSRLQQLYPDDERYASEIEEAIFNVNLANQDERGYIRYYTSLQGNKQYAGCYNTCCEVASAGFLARLPEFLYSIASDGLYVNLFSSSEISWKHDGQEVKLVADTNFPYSGDVSFVFSNGGKPATPMTLHIRIPSWAEGEVSVAVNGVAPKGVAPNGGDTAIGTPGTYLSLSRNWSEGDSVSFTLPMGFRLEQYTGLDQVEGNLDRYALLYGPVLMALVGELKGPGGVPRLSTSPVELPGLLRPTADSSFDQKINGYPGYTFRPYWQLTDETFTCFPIVEE